MNCLILAAGQGSRLRDISDSKPLALVTGRPLIEHVVRAAAEAGAHRFTIVTGHQAEAVEDFAASLGPRLGVELACVRSPDWNLPNGHSVLAGAAAIDGDYLLLMADHLFEAGIARRLLATADPGAGLTLAVDRTLDNSWLDLDDATRVETGPGGAIVRIGKQLERFDAVDTGIFLATPALAQALREAIADGRAGSLSDGVQRLADEGRAGTIDVSGWRWLDVDDAIAFDRAQDFAAPDDSMSAPVRDRPETRGRQR
jgi:1L-myo-inositol 1-phosphate cytidylyltransferase